MNVLNGEPFLKYQLASIYPFADEIIIVEGAYQKFAHAADPKGHSTDGTVEALKKFADPEGKIKLIQKDGFYPDRLEMCNEFFSLATGDVLWQVDVDEFYKPETHRLVRRKFEELPTLDRISFRVEEYFFSTAYVVCGAAYASGLSDVRRVFRLQEGDRWADQRPPTLAGVNGEPRTVRDEILAADMAREGHIIHHPTVLFEQQFRDKYLYYQKMWSSITQDKEWIDLTWKCIYNPLNILGIEPYCSWLDRREGRLPIELDMLENDAQSGNISGFNIRDNRDIDDYLKKDFSKEDARTGEMLNSVLKNSDLFSLRTWMSVFVCVSYCVKWGGSAKGVYVRKGLWVAIRRIFSKI
tara:strand:+ start:6623 stop:7684 length:1062 start_codon:yes stop_codon:yes gene_type:complete